MATRRSAEELRILLLDAGLRVLYRAGLRATASHVPMTAATDELSRTHGIEVSMGSIFGAGRLWTNVGEFQLDLLKAAVEDHNGGGPNDRSRALIHEHLDDQRQLPIEDRLNTLVELCRIAGELNGYVRTETHKGRSWDLWLGIWATAMTDAAANDALGESLRAEVRRTNQSFGAVYEVMLERLGLKLREPYTMDHLATLAAAITDGVALRSALDSDLTSGIRKSDDDQPWTLLGVGLKAIALELLQDAYPAES